METITPKLKEVTAIKKYTTLYRYKDSDSWYLSGTLHNNHSDALSYIPKDIDKIMLVEFDLPIEKEPILSTVGTSKIPAGGLITTSGGGTTEDP